MQAVAAQSSERGLDHGVQSDVTVEGVLTQARAENERLGAENEARARSIRPHTPLPSPA